MKICLPVSAHGGLRSPSGLDFGWSCCGSKGQINQTAEIILRSRARNEHDVASFISSAAKFCCRSPWTAVKELLKKMHYHDSEVFFRAAPDLISYAMVEKCNINLPDLVVDYLVVLRTMVKACDAYLVPVFKVLPQMQWLVNKMAYANICSAGRAVRELKCIESFLKARAESLCLECQTDKEPRDNFRQLSVVPTQSDVIDCPTPCIRPNKIVGPYDSVEQYLDINFRMMREDMLRTFRACINICRVKLNDSGDDISDGYLFTRVKVEFPPVFTLDGVCYHVMIECYPTDWNSAKSFKSGSLLCLTHDGFRSVTFVSVKDRVVLSDTQVRLLVIVEHTGEELSHKHKYALLEAGVYFEPYRHVLQCMKRLDEQTFPLADTIVYLNHRKSDLRHFAGSEFCLHDRASRPTDNDTVDTSCCQGFDVADIANWPSPEDLELDEGQLEAFHLALTEKVALIHGPPGTGKTYLACRIVRALLSNEVTGPVMVCCATNQTLDKFLSSLLKYTRKIVRLGSQSVSEVMKPHVLVNITESVRAYRISGEKALNSMDYVEKEAFYVAEIICPDLFMTVPNRKSEGARRILKSLCDELNHLYSSYNECKYSYFEDGILNKIIPLKYKAKILAGAGSSADILSRCVVEWLLLYKEQRDNYEQCREVFSKISDDRRHRKNENVNGDIDHFEEAEEDEDSVNVWRIPVAERFAMFYRWRKKLVKELKCQMKAVRERYLDAVVRFTRTVHCHTAKLLQCADIIGMTTCGAAKFKDMIVEAAPTVMIMEEAAEIFESHVIAALVPSVEQLILIGDHEQLRPLPATHEMGRDYHLNVSMFERLLKNGAPSVRLICQYRMRPSIAQLLVPEFYESLTTHVTVNAYPDVAGVATNVFFLKHWEQEDAFTSFRASSNDYEARFIAMLYKYLIEHGYQRSQITILSTYHGQIDVILKHIGLSSSDVKIFTVDGYQGEENDIVLISFVRSNYVGQIGFLSQSNRICVALSRAKVGLYCVGNFDLFAEKNELWESIVEKLHSRGLIGEEFPVRCKNHDEILHLEDPDEFSDFLKRGCGNVCGFLLPCRHRCERSCHFDDPEHLTYRCTAPCDKKIQIGKKILACRKKCWKKCLKQKKFAVILPCGHEVWRKPEKLALYSSDYVCREECPVRLPCGHLCSIPCYRKNDRQDCTASVSVVLGCGHRKLVPCHQGTTRNLQVLCEELVCKRGSCGHMVEVPCYQRNDDGALLERCVMHCEELLECGHPCTGSCSTCFRMKIHETCMAPCEQELPCGHECEGFCNSPCSDCQKSCDVPCSHSVCPNPCVRPCVKCTEPCGRGCEHKTCNKQCWESCSPCEKECEKTLPCGHSCVGLCGQRCPDLCRICDSGKLFGGNPDTDRYLMLDDCCHVLEINELASHFEDSFFSGRWPSCTVCDTPVRSSGYFDSLLKEVKTLTVKGCSTQKDYEQVKRLMKNTFRGGTTVSWKFLDIYERLCKILDEDRPSGASVHIIGQCLRALGKLSFMEEMMVKFAPSLIPRFDDLLAWIGNHLQQASYQQLGEVHEAIGALEHDVDQEVFGNESDSETDDSLSIS